MNRFLYPDREENAITTRPSHSAYMLIDAEDRYILNKQITNNIAQQTNPNNLLINTQKTLGLGSIKRLALTELYFPWTTPNVIAGYNDSLYIKDNSNNIYKYTIPEGFYTGLQLANQVQSSLNAGTYGKTWTVIYNIDNNTNPGQVILNKNCFTLTAGAGTLFKVLSNTSDTNTPYSLANIMGFTLTQYNTGNSITSGIASLKITRYIDICSRTLTKFMNIPDSQTQSNYDSIIYRLYIEDGTQPQIFSKQIIKPKYILWNENEMITSIDLQLRDDKGELLYIPSANWDNNYLLTMQVSES